MGESIVHSLATVELLVRESELLGLSPGPLGLRRAWPRGSARLLLEYADRNGDTIAGQWFAETGRCEEVAAETARSSAAPSVVVVDARVMLQARGVDRRLPGLAPLVARPGARLLVHRPERRGVVRLQGRGGERYAKVVRPDRVEAIVAAGRVGERIAGSAFAAPRLTSVDAGAGVAVWSRLDGDALYSLVGTKRFVPAMREVGRALKALHARPLPSWSNDYTAADEARWLAAAVERVKEFVPDGWQRLRAAASAVLSGLEAGSSPRVLLHRDFFDKQIIVDADGSVGILDFDTLASGEAALDIANAAVHLQLRAIQGLCTPAQAAEATAAFLDAYQPSLDVLERLSAYADAARLRLGCLYACRPAWSKVVPGMLLEELGKPLILIRGRRVAGAAACVTVIESGG